MDTDYDYGYDDIHTQPQPQHHRHNRHKPRHKRQPKHATKPMRKWCKIQKQTSLKDDRHLFYGGYDCYWCGECSCCSRKCDNCKEPDEEEFATMSNWVDTYIRQKYQKWRNYYWNNSELTKLRQYYLKPLFRNPSR